MSLLDTAKMPSLKDKLKATEASLEEFRDKKEVADIKRVKIIKKKSPKN